MKKDRFVQAVLGLSILCLFGISTLQAQIPEQLQFRGVLTDTNGIAIDCVDALVCATPPVIVVRIYTDSEAAIAPIFEETHQAVFVDQGIFDLEIGTFSPLDPGVFDQPLFLGLEINGDGEALPRQPILSVANAFQAIHAQHLGGLPGSEYVTVTDVGLLAGPKGESGEQGPQGESGEQGPQGESGEQGPQGESGEQGPEGPAGPAGPEGPAPNVDDFVSQTEFEALQAELAALQASVDALASGQTGGGGDPNAPLINDVHTVGECEADGGIVTEIPGPDILCRFISSSCPAGWAQLANWSTTTSSSAGGSITGQSQSCSQLGLSPSTCTVVGHPFLDQGPSACCGTNLFGFADGAGKPSCPPSASCTSTPIVEIGCF